jgi:DNA helicase-2/ATP-dependent DNA helicase PcrA
VLHAQANHKTLWEALGEAEAAGVHGGAKTAIGEFVAIVQKLGNAFEAGHNVVEATKNMIEDIKLYDDLKQAAASMSAAQRRIDNVTGLLNSLERWAAKGKGNRELAAYLRALSLDSGDDSKREGGDKIVMTTLHGAKGLEFPVCFMIGLEEELLPHARTLNPQATDVMDADHATDVSEERRLCYVGITRAQRKLYLTRACTRISRGRAMQRTPSRFLLEIPDELLEIRDLGEEARQQVPADEVKNFFANFQFDD